MRPTHKAEWLFATLPDGTKQFGGVILPGDYCAEHERGIGELSQLFEIHDDKSVFGPDRYKANHVPPEYVAFASKKHWAVLTVGVFNHVTVKPKHVNPEGISAKWGHDAFQITALGVENANYLRELHTAILNKDIALWLGGAGANPFARPGLVIHILSKVAPKDREHMTAEHTETYNLTVAVQATGIKQRLEATHTFEGCRHGGCCWYALSPKWTAFFKEPNFAAKTKQPIVFFLNPRDQQKYNSGWFTVEELDAWILGKGPVIKTDEQKAKEQAERESFNKK